MKNTPKYIIFLIIPICIACYAIAYSSKNTHRKAYIGSYSYHPVAISQNDHLKDAASFPIGVGFDVNELSDPNAKEIITREFNSITTAYSLDWHNVEPAENKFVFGPADKLIDFAQQNGLTVIGHNLIWFKFTPDWLQNYQGDAAAWENLFKTHIQTIVTHYKGKVRAWDVINEALDENGGQWDQIYNKGLNKTYVNVWPLHLGNDYMARAFTYAHEADPDAVLFYNDNSHERMPNRVQAIVAMVNDLKAKHVPIGGVGLQMHMDIHTTENGIKNALTQMASTGLQVRISELDVRLNPGSHSNDPDSLMNAKRQAYLFRYVAHAYKTLIPKDQQQFGITLWNVTDKGSWVNKPRKVDAPSLFDENYNRKPSYEAFISGLKQ
jgi:endo-1,4-beta-xylanase